MEQYVCFADSIKSRIETYEPENPGNRELKFVLLIPLNQGLKQRYSCRQFIFWSGLFC